MYVFKPEDIDVFSWSSDAKDSKGMSTGKVYSGVKVIHKPTGVSVENDSYRNQYKNRDAAFNELDSILRSEGYE